MTRLSLRALVPLGPALLLLAGCGSGSSSGATSSPTPAATSPAASSTGTPAAAPTPPASPGKPTPVPTLLPTPVVTGSVAAIINGHRVPISAYQLLLNVSRQSSPTQTLAALEKTVKQDIIYNELIREYAAAHGLKVTAAELAASEKQEIAAPTIGSEKAFKKLLAQRYGITVAQYRQIVAPSILGQKVEKQVAPVKGLLTDTQAKALAERLLNQLRHGADFATLAKKYSQDPGSAAKGGDLGEVQPGQTVPPFDHAAFHAPLKTYVLVHSTYGYHIIEVLSRGKAAPAGQPTAPKVESAHVRHILISTQASQTQQQQQSTAFIAWLQRQQNHASIKWLATTKSG